MLHRAILCQSPALISYILSKIDLLDRSQHSLHFETTIYRDVLPTFLEANVVKFGGSKKEVKHYPFTISEYIERTDMKFSSVSLAKKF